MLNTNFVTGSSVSTRLNGRHIVSRPRTATNRRVATGSVSYENEQLGMPPPPPPPPTPPPPTQTRRAFMSYLALAGAAAVGAGIGYTFGSNTKSNDGTGLTAEEKTEIDSLRDEAHFKRDYDGHLWIQSHAGEWWEVRLDAKLPGTVLLRDPRGYVHFITLNIQQIDLTDDYIVSALFGDGSWEAQAQRVQAKNEDGEEGEALVDAVMDSQAFRDMVSIIH